MSRGGVRAGAGRPLKITRDQRDRAGALCEALAGAVGLEAVKADGQVPAVVFEQAEWPMCNGGLGYKGFEFVGAKFLVAFPGGHDRPLSCEGVL